jgi:hypothetical protein
MGQDPLLQFLLDCFAFYGIYMFIKQLRKL